MEIKAVVHDENGNPYTLERFISEPQSAQEFLEIFKANSHGYLPEGWEELEHDHLIDVAVKSLRQLSSALSASEILGRLNHIQ